MGGRRPSRREIAETDDAMRRRQQQLRLAAEYVAEAFGQEGAVERVALFRSVAAPLTLEVPRFREFRRAGVAVLHECKDVDLAVWLADLGCLRRLQMLKAQGLAALLRERKVGVAHH